MKNAGKPKTNRLRRLYENGKLQSFGFQISVYAIPLTLFAIFWVGVNFNSILMAFQKISFDGTRTFVGFENFGAFFAELRGEMSDTLLRTSILNSFKMFAINLIVCMPLYLLFSFYLFRKFFGSRAILIIVMIPSIVSEFIISLIFKRFVNVVLPNLFGGLPALLEDPKYTFGTMLFFMIWISFSTSLIVYPNAMRAISAEIFESAQIDGAGYWKEFWYITFPLIFPTISTFLIMGVSAIFLNAGPAVAFFQYNAYPECYTMGYYYIAKVMNATNEMGYPMLAAGGIVLTLVSCPMTFGVKYGLEKITPERDL